MTGKKIILVAGGTGGHVFPAISLAEKLREWATIFSSLLISEEKNLR